MLFIRQCSNHITERSSQYNKLVVGVIGLLVGYILGHYIGNSRDPPRSIWRESLIHEENIKTENGNNVRQSTYLIQTNLTNCIMTNENENYRVEFDTQKGHCVDYNVVGIGEPCIRNKQCRMIGSICREQICNCHPEETHDGKKCLPKLYDVITPCENSKQCENLGRHAYCGIGVCECKNQYRFSPKYLGLDMENCGCCLPIDYSNITHVEGHISCDERIHRRCPY